VNESYPSECIQFRSVLDTSHPRFRVNGTPTTAEKEKSPEAEPSPPDSLPLKASRREKNQSPERCLSQVEEPTPNPLPRDSPETVRESVPDAVTSEPDHETATEEACKRGNWERDALDDIIDEAKATSHLVCPLLCQ
jgi:DNA polymerase IV